MPSNLSMPARQFWMLVAGGLVLWLVAALMLRFLGPLGIYDGSARVILYTLIIPGTYPFLWGLTRLVGLAKDQIAVGVAVGTAAATMMDGAALAWFPQLYGAAVELHAGAGGTILWGAGVGIFIACFMNRPAS